MVRLETDHRYPPVASHEELLHFYGVDSRGIRSAVLGQLTVDTGAATFTLPLVVQIQQP